MSITSRIILNGKTDNSLGSIEVENMSFFDILIYFLEIRSCFSNFH
ncbi:hypothetical protein [Maribacter thermophilus]|nr:hypothetical protein [Maribacter thermophilus]